MTNSPERKIKLFKWKETIIRFVFGGTDSLLPNVSTVDRRHKMIEPDKFTKIYMLG